MPRGYSNQESPSQLAARLLSGGKHPEFVVDPVTGCWLWQFNIDNRGYGRYKYKNQTHWPHRFVCEAAHGPAPEDRPCSLHSCDCPPCINPEHLRWGSHRDNALDRHARGRTSSMGATHHKAKLTEADVLEIRASVGVTQQELADRFGVTQGLIYGIKAGKIWKHLK